MGEAKKLYRVKHTECDLWIKERAGSWAEWTPNKEEAMTDTKYNWEKDLSPSIHYLLVLEEVSNG